MCGIAGELKFRHGRTAAADWQRIGALMARRGPDDSGSWTAPDAGCTMIFRRLAILDLTSAGGQPMCSPDGRHVLVFNGEVYNFRELRAQLEARGRRLRSTGDAEVVMHALAEWGRAALDRFNGMFALAFYDAWERRLLLARDHAGIKPLYYLRCPMGVFFASQYDQILSHPWARDLRVSMEALSSYVRFAYVPAPHGLLAGTHMLEPGCWLEADGDGRVRGGRYFEFPCREPSIAGAAQAAEAVGSTLAAAVRRQLVSDVKVAAFLSGGVDSPLISAMMQQASRGPVTAYTVGTEEAQTDESDAAGRYAQALGLSHVLHRATADQALEMLDDVVAACGEPLGDYSIFPTMLVSQLAARDVKVVLSGDGGDELFWGYAKRSAQLIRGAGAFAGPRWWRGARWALSKYTGMGGGQRAVRRFDSVGDWQRAMHTHLPASRLAALFPTLPRRPAGDAAYEYSGWRRDRTAQWLRRNEFSTHLPMVLLKVDRASMYHSLEVRVPMLDREVIDMAAQIDWKSCLDLGKGMGKLPLRAALFQRVQFQTTQKKGFGVPVGDWLRGALRPAVEECLLGRDDILGLPVQRRALRGLFDEHCSGSVDYGWGLWPLLSLALWERNHFQGRGSDGLASSPPAPDYLLQSRRAVHPL